MSVLQEQHSLVRIRSEHCRKREELRDKRAEGITFDQRVARCGHTHGVRGGRDGSALSMRAVARTTSALASMSVLMAVTLISLSTDRSCR